MSIIRTYSCDLCHGRGGGLAGICWERRDGLKLVIKPAISAYHHLCRECVDALLAADFQIEWFHYDGYEAGKEDRDAFPDLRNDDAARP